MAINKQKGNYVQTLLSTPTLMLLDKFHKITGYSKSFIIKRIVEAYLPLEVELKINQMEVINETSTQIQKS